MGLAAVTPSQGGGLPPGDVYEHELQFWVDQIWLRQSGSDLQWQPATAQLFPAWVGTDGSGPSNRFSVTTQWAKYRWPTGDNGVGRFASSAIYVKSPTGAIVWTIAHPAPNRLYSDTGPMEYVIRHDQSSVTPDVISAISWPVPSSLRQVAKVPGQRRKSLLRRIFLG